MTYPHRNASLHKFGSNNVVFKPLINDIVIILWFGVLFLVLVKEFRYNPRMMGVPIYGP